MPVAGTTAIDSLPSGPEMQLSLRQRLIEYARLMRLDRPVGIWLLLWPVLWALWTAAEGLPSLKLLLIFVLGTVLMRSAGCVINDFADRNVDPHVARTRERPLAARRVTTREALLLFAVLCLLAFGLVLQTNALTIALSLPAVLLAASYPFAKRFHHLPQAHLGLAFAWGIPMAQAAVNGVIDMRLCILLMLATVTWAMAYDTFYAMVDREDDLKIGVRSSAILFGRADRLITALLQLLVLGLLALAGALAGRGAVFAVGLLAAAVLAVYQQWLIRHREPQACLRAFLNNHWFGAAVFAGLAMDYALE
jgi:4-hydroxybenzoate polyprenyltransferase